MQMPRVQETPDGATRRTEPFMVIAFLVAFFGMLFPIQGDFLYSAVRRGHFAEAAVWATAWFLAVVIPFILSCRRFLREPRRWRGRGVLFLIGAILLLDVFGVAMVYRSEGYRFYHGHYR